MIFKKKLTEETEKILAKIAEDTLGQVNQSFGFIERFHQYKLRKDIKLTDLECKERIVEFIKNIQTAFVKLIIAENILQENHLSDMYNVHIKNISELIISNTMKQKGDKK